MEISIPILGGGRSTSYFSSKRMYICFVKYVKKILDGVKDLFRLYYNGKSRAILQICQHSNSLKMYFLLIKRSFQTILVQKFSYQICKIYFLYRLGNNKPRNIELNQHLIMSYKYVIQYLRGIAHHLYQKKKEELPNFIDC